MGTFDAATFVTTYLPIPVFFILFVVYKLVKKSKFVKYEDMDFVSGCSADIPLNVSEIWISFQQLLSRPFAKSCHYSQSDSPSGNNWWTTFEVAG